MTTRPPARPPRLAHLVLRAILPDSVAGRSTLGDLIEEYSHRPAGLTRRLWFWATTAEMVVHYLPSRFVAACGGAGADVIFAIRLSRRYPGLIVTAVASLSLAIGLSAAAFTIANNRWLRPTLNIDRSVVKVWRHHTNGAGLGWPESEFRQLRERALTIALEGALPQSEPVSGPADAAPMPQQVEFVTGGFFDAIRAMPTAGRLLGRDDDRPGARATVVLDRMYWRRHFAGDPAVIGQSLSIRGQSFLIVGIGGRDFVDPIRNGPDMWAALAALSTVQAGTTPAPAPQPLVIGRLAPGVSMADVNGELTRLMASVAPAPKAPRATGFEAVEVITPSEIDASRRMLFATFAVIALVLILAGANVSNLQLAGAAARRQEVALRVAMGASRARLLRQMLTEGLLLSAVSCGLGLVAARWFGPVLAAGMDMTGADLDPDLRVYGFVATAATMIAVATSLAPGYGAALASLATTLTKGGSRPAVGHSGAGRVRAVLVGVQAAASILLVTIAALQVRTLLSLAWMDPGTAVDELVGVYVPLFSPGGPSNDAATQVFWPQALERVRAVPGVESAALATFTPLNTSFGGPYRQLAENATDANYFTTVGLRVIRGRTYTAREVIAHEPVAVISEALARRYWPNQNPLGQKAGRIKSVFQAHEVVGVVADAFVDRVYSQLTGTIYLPLTEPDMFTKIAVRTRTPDAVAAAVGRTLDDLTPGKHASATVVGETYARELARPRRYAALGTSVAFFALVLSAAGLIGVTSFAVRRRTREIGIRLALGARRGDVLRMMLADGVRPVVVGLAAGLLATLVGGHLIAGLLFGMSERDPIALGVGVALLLAAATAAVWLPARRAARLDPAVVLRDA